MSLNLGDNPVQKWLPFNGNDLSHLNATLITYQLSGNTVYDVYVTYSHHCFTKTEEGYNDEHELLYNLHNFSKTDLRHFHLRRFELSKKLPDIIEKLPSMYVFCAGHQSHATVQLFDENGDELNYLVVFKVFKVKKKIRLHVTSAYINDEKGKRNKVGFDKIIKAVHDGRKVPGFK